MGGGNGVIKEIQTAIDTIHAKYLSNVCESLPASTEGLEPALTDDEVISIASFAKNNEKFSALWRGDKSDYANNHSAGRYGTMRYFGFLLLPQRRTN